MRSGVGHAGAVETDLWRFTDGTAVAAKRAPRAHPERHLLSDGGLRDAEGPALSPVVHRIENVVAAARLGGPWDIVTLSRRLQGAEYHPDRFVGLVVHVPEGSALVFEDGQVVTTGARGVEEALAQMEHVRAILAKAGAETTAVEGFTIRNLVVTAEVGRRVPLDQVVLAFPDEDIEYAPDTFPGLVLRLKDPRMTLLVFGSGRLVATGTGDMPAVEEALTDFIEALQERQLVVEG